MRQHQRGRGHLLAIAGGRNIDHEAKIQMAVVEPGDQPIGRLAHNRKYSDHLAWAWSLLAPDVLRPNGVDQNIAQRQQRFGPSRLARDHPLGRMPCIQRAAVDRDAVGVDELRAGQQRSPVNLRCDLNDGHDDLKPARQQPEAQEQKSGINQRPAGQPDPDADRAQWRPEAEAAGAG